MKGSSFYGRGNQSPAKGRIKDWWKDSKLKKSLTEARDTIQEDIHEVAGKVSKGFEGTDTEKVVDTVKSTEVYKDVKEAGDTVVKDAKNILGKLFKRKEK